MKFISFYGWLNWELLDDTELKKCWLAAESIYLLEPITNKFGERYSNGTGRLKTAIYFSKDNIEDIWFCEEDIHTILLRIDEALSKEKK
jgi:hypothetical protein